MSASPLNKAFTDHSRQWKEFQLVYPVISRRSRGLSIGINLNPDQLCNFDCVYCCVERGDGRPPRAIDPGQLHGELAAMLELVRSGRIWQDEPFASAPPDYRALRDIAFSGDGEPTMCLQFAQACQLAADLRRQYQQEEARLVLITNGTLLRRQNVQDGLAILDAHGGEIWIKLDAGSEGYFRAVNRGHVGLATILENILHTGRQRPVVIQTMFNRLAGQDPPAAELAAYRQRLVDLRAQGCQIKLIQLYSLARRPAESEVQLLPEARLQEIARQLRQCLPEVPCEVFPGVEREG